MSISRPMVIGVTGGSGSGKTTVSQDIIKRLAGESVVMIPQDAYYHDQSDKNMDERRMTNYDHPDSLDNELLISQLKQLLERKTIEQPVYDYTNHTRSTKKVTIQPADVIILEGVLLFTEAKLRDLLDIKIYVDTDDDLRFIRRMQRDIVERGRTVDSVVNQYLETVKPMYHQFVEPTKRYADIILPEGGANTVGIGMLEAQIRDILNKNKA
ncbi:uridine kinase [Weissella sagaensis]|uniref:Uridine kinase n=1 Tax=Weissella sagaensis TaxID=2559928 RepID=A0ABW1RU69_9LACO|nr:uridine kinase [Weissella sagaensis]KAA8433597.1 uridine kinase [Weissella paramesenteroides]MBU7567999.1 uridine kinase [Weissella hellenica]KAA8438584.1 uridine kinase [Weissella paramesenteroides]QEA57840.1 uridine kinase [Weissella hellenica]UEG66970.1 uridine kinase [Weissella hellenica]